MSVAEFTYTLPRTAFTSRERARGGDLLRAFQDVAVEAASMRGWPPPRMRAVGSVWIVRSITVEHVRETSFGERLRARSWVRRNRRSTLSTRELELHADDGLVARATQEWAHMGSDGPCRMPEAMERDLGIVDEGGVEFPPFDPATGPTFRFAFEVWEVWMDPVGHVNHPQYVDFADECVMRAVRQRGADPVKVVPVADSVMYRKQLVAGDRATVETRVVGSRGPDVVFSHRILGNDGQLAAEVTSARRGLDFDLGATLAGSLP